MQNLVASVPPSFCWKKGGDFGTIPTRCSSGFFRSLALCYQYCRKTYRHVLGVCWEDCPKGWSDIGLLCFKGVWWQFWNWHFRGKGSYIPQSYTNFDARAACEPGKYKFGALCYRDCGNVGLVNCGIGACSATGPGCISSIINMIAQVIMAVAQAIVFVCSFGSSSAGSSVMNMAKNAVTNGIKKLGQGGMKAAFTVIKRIATNKTLRNKFLKEALGKAAKEVGKKVADEICTKVGEQMFSNVEKKEEAPSGYEVESLDFTGISGIVKACSNVGTTNNNIACAKAAMETASMVDPTGLLSLATAFMQPICDV